MKRKNKSSTPRGNVRPDNQKQNGTRARFKAAVRIAMGIFRSMPRKVQDKYLT